jgi:hypothetical protein
VRVENNPDLNPTNQLTIEAWVYLTDDPSWDYAIVRKDAECSNRQYMLTAVYGDNEYLGFRAHVGIEGGGYNYLDSASQIYPQTWYHVAEVYDGTNLIIYVNGNLDNSAELTGHILVTSEPVCIGGSDFNCGNYGFPGLIDEVAIYNRALSDTEISAIYSAGCAGKCKVDTDGDGLSDLQELFLGTDRNKQDTDGDGLNDWDEVFVYHLDPRNQDTDGDHVIDQPFKVLITSPRTGAILP